MRRSEIRKRKPGTKGDGPKEPMRIMPGTGLGEERSPEERMLDMTHHMAREMVMESSGTKKAVNRLHKHLYTQGKKALQKMGML